MKSIRYFAALLLLLTGVMHALPVIRASQQPDALPMFIFGMVYFTIGILLILNLKFAPLLGIIFPLIGLGTGFLLIGLKNLDGILCFLLVIDVNLRAKPSN